MMKTLKVLLVSFLCLWPLTAHATWTASEWMGVRTISIPPTFPSLTQGSVLFIGPGGVLSEDNDKLFFDDTLDRFLGGPVTTAGRDPAVAILPKLVMQGTGALTNGSTNTVVTYIDATPVGEWTGIDGSVVTSTDSTYYKEGSASLKVAIAAAASAADTILNPLGGGDENWSARESVGVWIYSDVALSAGDFDFRITDSVAGDADTDIPAVAVNTWTWVEVDISGVADASKDVITDIAFVMTVDKGLMNIYLDFLAKWDVTDETALDQNILQDGMLGVSANPVASATAMAWVSQTEYTDYFINYAASGNGNVVVITDESANCFLMTYAHE